MKCGVDYSNIKADKILNIEQGMCPVDETLKMLVRARDAECGRNVYCRDGLAQITRIVKDITSGKGQPDDIELLKDILTAGMEAGGCEMLAKVSDVMLKSIAEFEDEWSAHCRRKRCSAMVCREYYSLYVDPEVCNGCGMCAKEAPEGSIAYEPGCICVIKDDSGLKNEKFISICPLGAIKKAGALKPRLPEDPVPVGSFSPRRRRRER